MTEDEIIELGYLAENLARDEGFNALFEKVTKDLSLEILGSTYEDKDYREQLYLTYNGMRAFADRITQFALAKSEIEKTRNEQDAFNNEQQEVN
jgi:hypothetical protein